MRNDVQVHQVGFQHRFECRHKKDCWYDQCVHGISMDPDPFAALTDAVLQSTVTLCKLRQMKCLRSVAQRYLRPKLSTRFSLCLINPCPSERFGRSLVEILLQASRSFCILTSLQIL